MTSIRKWVRGDHNVICDICGKKKKWFETTLAYATGDIAAVVSCLDGCADYRHPLNSPPPLIFDGQPVEDARPDITQNNKETYVGANTINSMMQWGHLVNAGTWGHLNPTNQLDSNSNSLSFNVPWEWGYIRRN